MVGAEGQVVRGYVKDWGLGLMLGSPPLAPAAW